MNSPSAWPPDLHDPALDGPRPPPRGFAGTRFTLRQWVQVVGLGVLIPIVWGSVSLVVLWLCGVLLDDRSGSVSGVVSFVAGLVVAVLLARWLTPR